MDESLRKKIDEERANVDKEIAILNEDIKLLSHFKVVLNFAQSEKEIAHLKQEFYQNPHDSLEEMFYVEHSKGTKELMH